MEKQLLTTVVVLLFCLLYTAAIAAQTKDPTEGSKRSPDDTAALAGADAWAQIQTLGFGKRIDVRLKDGSKASGRITGLAADRFVVTNANGDAKPVAYAEVSRIAKQKEKLGLFHKPWVAIMFTAAGVGTLIVLAMQVFD